MNTGRVALGKITVLLVAVVAFAFSLKWVRPAAGQSKSDDASTEIKLKKEIEALAGFEGKWSCQGIFPSSGKHIESQIVFAPDLEGAWLTVRHDDRPPNRYHAFQLWGFDPVTKQFVAYIYDNFGGARRFTSAGWVEGKLIWTGETTKTDPPVAQRFVFKRDNPTQFVTNYEVKQGTSDWAIGDTLTCKK